MVTLHLWTSLYYIFTDFLDILRGITKDVPSIFANFLFLLIIMDYIFTSDKILLR